VKPIRLLLADDMTLIRHGIRALMTGVHDIEIVGEAATAEDAILLARALHPHVVLIDQDLPGDGLQATGAIKGADPEVEVVVMTEEIDLEKAMRAVEAGATGYIVKDIPSMNLAGALRSLSNGRHFYYPESTRQRLERLKRFSCDGTRLKLAIEGLTSRELDILTQLAQGRTDREVAAALVVAEGTVKTHIRNILRKLGVRNRTHAVAYVFRRGLIS
jgi:DNA-binding NarL/FixJ family response regulator